MPGPSRESTRGKRAITFSPNAKTLSEKRERKEDSERDNYGTRIKNGDKRFEMKATGKR